MIAAITNGYCPNNTSVYQYWRARPIKTVIMTLMIRELVLENNCVEDIHKS